MIKTVLQLVALCLALLIVQVLCSKIVLFGVATPFVLIYFIMHLPINFSVNWTVTIAFAMGIIIDCFNNTPGMCALSCTLLATVRRPVFNAYFLREDDDPDSVSPMPSMGTLGIGGYMKYAATLTVFFCTVMFLIQAFTFHNLSITLLRIACSSLLTFVALIAIDSLLSTSREKGL